MAEGGFDFNSFLKNSKGVIEINCQKSHGKIRSRDERTTG